MTILEAITSEKNGVFPEWARIYIAGHLPEIITQLERNGSAYIIKPDIPSTVVLGVSEIEQTALRQRA